MNRFLATGFFLVQAVAGCSGANVAAPTTPAVDSLAGVWNVEVDLSYGPAFYVVGGLVTVGVPRNAIIPRAPANLSLSASPQLNVSGYEPPDFGISCQLADSGCWLNWPSVPVRPLVVPDTVITVQATPGGKAAYEFSWTIYVWYNLYDQNPRQTFVTWPANSFAQGTWADTSAAMLVRVTRGAPPP